jgi:hypothetical protein
MISAEALNSDGSAMPWSARCAAETADYQARAMRDTGAQVVVWLSGWEAADHLFGGQQLVFGTLTGDAAVMGELEASVDRLSASGARVVILTQPPRTPDNDIGLPATSEVVDRLEHLNVLYQRLEVERPDSVLLVDFDAIVCPGGPPCPGYVDGVRLRPYDGSHFDAGGAAWVAPRVIAAIVAALRAAP